MSKITVLLLVLIGLLQYRLWFGDGNVREFQRMNDRIAELHQEGARRRERNAALEAEVMDLKQGLDAVEERARQDMDMIKDGEVFVQVIDPQAEHDDEAPAPKVPPKPAAAKSGKDDKPAKPKRSAETPRPTESPAKAKKPPAAAKPPAAKPPAPKKPPAKPKPAPKPAAPADDPIEERPPNEEPD
ncbi:MAG: cell division protein FtsB [Candidatus Methylumidiphilus sp.]